MLGLIVIKRNGNKVYFDIEKIEKAIEKALFATGEGSEKDSKSIASRVLKKINKEEINVEDIQDAVEIELMNSGFAETAKAYILYRAKASENRKLDLFKKRVNFKPYEYPHLVAYQEAIQHSYWLFSEFNYTSDIQDFKVSVDDKERNAIKNAMLAVSQVEVAVKNFWGEIHLRMPKPEVGAVGAVFAESEVRHSDSYSHLLEILGMNDEFDNIDKIPALNNRVKYLNKVGEISRSEDNRDYTLSLILFSLFIENVSLFSQFLIIMSFNKYKNIFKGISNVQEASSKEERIHGEFGMELVNILREEKPEWFDESMKKDVIEACLVAYDSEEQVIDWIYEAGDLDFVPKHDVKEFIKDRMNQSLEGIGYEPIFEIDRKALESTEWFNDVLYTTVHVDFFNKRSVNYSKRTKSITGDDLF